MDQGISEMFLFMRNVRNMLLDENPYLIAVEILPLLPFPPCGGYFAHPFTNWTVWLLISLKFLELRRPYQLRYWATDVDLYLTALLGALESPSPLFRTPACQR